MLPSTRLAGSTALSSAMPLSKTRSPFACGLLVILAFAFLYNISFLVNESASTARVAVVMLALYLLARGDALYEQAERLIWLLFVPLPYVAALAVMSGDMGQFSRFANLALYAFLGANMFARVVGELDDLLVIILGAVAIQALIIFYSFVSVDYRLWMGATVASGSNTSVLSLYRAPGLASAGESSLSVVQSLGVLTGGLLLYERRVRGSARGTTWILSQMLLCMASCIFVGRTGLILSAFFLVVLCLHAGATTRLLTICLAVGVPAVLLASQHLEALMPPSFSLDFFADWAFGFLISGRDESVSDLATMPVPPLNLETLFGTGLVSLTRWGNPSGHDSGFVQAYYAMGLPMTVLFYLAYGLVLLRLLRWLPLTLRLLIAVPLFAIEAKEPFVFKYASMFVLVAVYTLATRAAVTGSRASAR